MASGPHTFVTMVVFSATKFEGSRHLVLSPRGPPNYPPFNTSRKARHASEFSLSSTIYMYDTPPMSPSQPTLRRLEIFRSLGTGKGLLGFGMGEVGFEAGAVLAAAHYLCTYIERSPYWSSLPRGGVEAPEMQQRVSFYLPRLQQQQQKLLQQAGSEAGQKDAGNAAPVADGRVNIMFNAYRQVAAVAVPSVSTLFKIHKKKIPLKDVLVSQPQVQIVPDFEKLNLDTTGEKTAECPIVSLGLDMHFILVDLTAAPAILPALMPSPAASKSIEELIILDDLPGWGAEALKSGLVGTIWFARGKKDTVRGEATIENLRCRVFSPSAGVMAGEEEGLGSAAAVVGGWLSLLAEGRSESEDEGEGGKVGGGVREGVEKLNVSNTENEKGAEGKDAEGGAEITPTATHTQNKGSETSPGKEKVERKVFGIHTGVEMGRNGMVAVEVDVLCPPGGERRLGGLVVSGRANFESKGELLGS